MPRRFEKPILRAKSSELKELATIMQVKESLRGLSPYQPGKSIEEVKRQYGLPEIIKLASNENPYGSSPSAKAAIAAELDRLAVYPDAAPARCAKRWRSILASRKHSFCLATVRMRWCKFFAAPF
ncbi:Histidinol-phosphate aminotransferase [Geobacillus sp. WSUCF1]|nr:Histidinol-phosphate aminotransferase [Geobacillus sp. WSUCF1]